MRFSKKIKPVLRDFRDVLPDYGCLEPDAFDWEVEAYAMSNAIPFESLHLHSEGDAPVIDFGSLEPFFELRKKRYENTGPLFSWADGYYFYNQKNLGSCTGHAAAHAFMASNRHIRIHKGIVIQKSVNPIGAWYKSKNWSTRGGQSVARMAAEVNEFGNVPESRIGTNNIQPSKQAILAAAKEAAFNQSAICFFKPTAANVINFVRSGIGVFIGNRLRVSGTQTDSNGMRIPKFSGSWAHATSFTDYANVEGVDYAFWLNSWGPIYKTPDKFNAPAWGCWMESNHLKQFLTSAASFGNACAVFAE